MVFTAYQRSLTMRQTTAMKRIWSLESKVTSQSDPLSCLIITSFLWITQSLTDSVWSLEWFQWSLWNTISGSHVGRLGHPRCVILKRDSANAGTHPHAEKWEVGSSQGLAAAGWLVCWTERSWSWGHSQCPDRAGPVSWSVAPSSLVAPYLDLLLFPEEQNMLLLNLKGHFLERIKRSLFFNETQRTHEQAVFYWRGRNVLFRTINGRVTGKILTSCQEGIFTGILNIYFLEQGTMKKRHNTNDTETFTIFRLFL